VNRQAFPHVPQSPIEPANTHCPLQQMNGSFGKSGLVHGVLSGVPRLHLVLGSEMSQNLSVSFGPVAMHVSPLQHFWAAQL
jgi:hypothetical protein